MGVWVSDTTKKTDLKKNKMKKNLKEVGDTLNNRIISGFVCQLMNCLCEYGFISDYKVNFNYDVILVPEIRFTMITRSIDDSGLRDLTEQLWLLNNETENLLMNEKEFR